MRPPLRRADLERRLEAVPRHEFPDPDLEQYRTPAGIAAELLWLAWEDGAVAYRRVLDLGCGTGIFALGAALLGAREVGGVDVDASSIATARGLLEREAPDTPATFWEADVTDWRADTPWDTVIMNPPFGAQHGGRHADRAFLRTAREAVSLDGSVWFLALERTQGFLHAFLRDLGGRVEKVAAWAYPLDATMTHHSEAVRTMPVGGYRATFGR